MEDQVLTGFFIDLKRSGVAFQFDDFPNQFVMAYSNQFMHCGAVHFFGYHH